MSWFAPSLDAPSPFEGILQLRPALLELHRVFYGTLWDRTLAPANLLELCRLRIAGIHGCESEHGIRHMHAAVTDEQVAALDHWRTAACFSSSERAVLAFAEKVPWQHHAITDDDVALLRAHLTDGQFVALALAAVLFDAHCRLRLVFGVEPRVCAVGAPASACGVLY